MYYAALWHYGRRGGHVVYQEEHGPHRTVTEHTNWPATRTVYAFASKAERDGWLADQDDTQCSAIPAGVVRRPPPGAAPGDRRYDVIYWPSAAPEQPPASSHMAAAQPGA